MATACCTRGLSLSNCVYFYAPRCSLCNCKSDSTYCLRIWAKLFQAHSYTQTQTEWYAYVLTCSTECGVSLLIVADIQAADNGLCCLQHPCKSNTGWHTHIFPVKIFFINFIFNLHFPTISICIIIGLISITSSGTVIICIQLLYVLSLDLM